MGFSRQNPFKIHIKLIIPWHAVAGSPIIILYSVSLVTAGKFIDVGHMILYRNYRAFLIQDPTNKIKEYSVCGPACRREAAMKWAPSLTGDGGRASKYTQNNTFLLVITVWRLL